MSMGTKHNAIICEIPYLIPVQKIVTPVSTMWYMKFLVNIGKGFASPFSRYAFRDSISLSRRYGILVALLSKDNFSVKFVLVRICLISYLKISAISIFVLGDRCIRIPISSDQNNFLSLMLPVDRKMVAGAVYSFNTG